MITSQLSIPMYEDLSGEEQEYVDEAVDVLRGAVEDAWESEDSEDESDPLSESGVDTSEVDEAKETFRDSVLQAISIGGDQTQTQVAAEATNAFEEVLDRVRDAVEEGRGDAEEYDLEFVVDNAMREMDIDRGNQDDVREVFSQLFDE